jgi:hypothetical protein
VPNYGLNDSSTLPHPFIVRCLKPCFTAFHCFGLFEIICWMVRFLLLNRMRRLYAEQENIFYDLTVMNENYPQPALPKALKGCECVLRLARARACARRNTIDLASRPHLARDLTSELHRKSINPIHVAKIHRFRMSSPSFILSP